MAQQDIAPMLLELLQKDFLDLLGDAAFSGGSYADAEDYAEKVGAALAEAFRCNLTADTLPDGKLYWNIADRVVRPMLEQDHALVADAAATAQQKLNELAGLNLKAQRAVLDENRVNGILQKAAAVENFEDAAWVLDEPVRTFSRMTVDDTLKANVDFQGKAGRSPRVIRTAESGCCKWCSAQTGTYTYPDVPQDVYRRHERCRCRVEYDPGSGKRQNVWNKQWTEDEDQRRERIQKIQNLSTETDDSAKIELRKQIGQSVPDTPEIAETKAFMTRQVLALPQESQDVLQEYTGFTATKVNFAIRNGRVTPQIQTTIDALDKALQGGVMPQEVTLYRNTVLSFLDLTRSRNPDEAELFKLVDRKTTMPIYLSTSFYDLRMPGRDTLLIMHVPAGYTGCQFLQPVAYPKFKNQQEVLFSRGMSYRILDAQIQNGRYILEVEVLKNG